MNYEQAEITWTPSLVRAGAPLYVAIVEALSNDIASGELASDTRLPTQRELADQLGVAIGTVTRAYAEAERRGLIRSEGRRGTFVGEPRTGKAILANMARFVSQGIDLSKNHPVPALDPPLAEALRKLTRSRDSQRLLEYPPPAGLTEHREAGAAWFARMGAEVDPDGVFVTAGAQHALSTVVGAETRSGDCIAAEDYTYPGIKAVADLLDLSLIGIATDHEGIVPEALDAACRKRKIRLLYCNPSIQNPTNTTSSPGRRAAIADVVQHHGLMVIEDEIMRPFVTDDPGYISTLIPDRSFLIVSASKTVAAGIRVGFVVAPAASRQRLVESLNASCLGAPPLMVQLLVDWLGDGTVDRILARRYEELGARQELTAGMLEDFQLRSHPGSYHVWLDLPEGWSGMSLAMAAQREGVVVSPAEAFATDHRAVAAAIRLSVGSVPTREQLTAGLSVLGDLLRGTPGKGQATV